MLEKEGKIGEQVLSLEGFFEFSEVPRVQCM